MKWRTFFEPEISKIEVAESAESSLGPKNSQTDLKEFSSTFESVYCIDDVVIFFKILSDMFLNAERVMVAMA